MVKNVSKCLWPFEAELGDKNDKTQLDVDFKQTDHSEEIKMGNK
jgi:hypothetical protein